MIFLVIIFVMIYSSNIIIKLTEVTDQTNYHLVGNKINSLYAIELYSPIRVQYLSSVMGVFQLGFFSVIRVSHVHYKLSWL